MRKWGVGYATAASDMVFSEGAGDGHPNTDAGNDRAGSEE